MEISVEEIIKIVTREVISELSKRGIKVTGAPASNESAGDSAEIAHLRNKSEKIDMSSYKTPLLTERHVNKLNELVGEIIIPKGTIITPKAREAIKRKNLTIKFE